MECLERISKKLVRPEIKQARHRLAFRALWKWPNRATLEREIGSLKRGLDAGQRRSSRSARSLVRFVHITGEEFRPLAHETGLVNLSNKSVSVTHRN